MKLAPYPEYKDAGVPWLGKIPEHWNFKRNKNILIESKDTVGENSKDFTLLSLTLHGVIARDIESGKGKFPKEFDTYKKVVKDDLVFCLFDIDETPRTVGLSPLNGMITGAYDVFRVINSNEKYIYYYYLSLDNTKAMKPLYTGLRKVINVPVFKGTKLPVPPLPEQDQIVRFLDYKLVQIAKLIKAKKKLIAALKEQKQAVINRAVTKGLNPNAKMKPSGIDWLGDVPQGWEIRRLKYFAKSNMETLTDSFSKESIIYYIDISTVGFGEIKRPPVKYVFKDAPSRARRVIHTGDTIISTVRTYLKSMCYIDENLDSYIASTGFAVLTPSKKVFPKLLNYVLSSAYFVNRVSQNANGVSYPAITENNLIGFKIALPSDICEQKELLEYIQQKTQEIDKTIIKAQQEIDLITEYRIRLISDVVTGKVDVRGINVEPVENIEDIEEFDEVEENETSEEICEIEA